MFSCLNDGNITTQTTNYNTLLCISDSYRARYKTMCICNEIVKRNKTKKTFGVYHHVQWLIRICHPSNMKGRLFLRKHKV